MKVQKINRESMIAQILPLTLHRNRKFQFSSARNEFRGYAIEKSASLA